MSQYKSKAEERRTKCVKWNCNNSAVIIEEGQALCADHCEGWLTRNLADPEFAAAYQAECAKDSEIARLERAVIDAAERWHKAVVCQEQHEATADLHIACAALAVARSKR